MNKSVNLIGPLNLNIEGIIKSYPTVLIDGAFRWRDLFKNSMSVGDRDSLENKKGSHFDFTYPQEKDETDLKLALWHLEESFTWEEINAYGLMGGRADHELGNFFEFYRFLEKKTQKKINIFKEDKIHAKFLAKGRYTLLHQGLFSLFTFKEDEIHLDGCVKYKINDQNKGALPLSALGVSNKASGEFYLETKTPTLLFLV